MQGNPGGRPGWTGGAVLEKREKRFAKSFWQALNGRQRATEVLERPVPLRRVRLFTQPVLFGGALRADKAKSEAKSRHVRGQIQHWQPQGCPMGIFRTSLLVQVSE